MQGYLYPDYTGSTNPQLFISRGVYVDIVVGQDIDLSAINEFVDSSIHNTISSRLRRFDENQSIFLIECDEKDISDLYDTGFTTQKCKVIKKIPQSEIIKHALTSLDAVGFAKAYPKYRFQLVDLIDNDHDALLYATMYPETKDSLQHHLLADDDNTYINQWINLFPQTRTAFIHKINTFDIAFTWAKRFPEDIPDLLMIIDDKGLATPENMKEWNDYFQD